MRKTILLFLAASLGCWAQQRKYVTTPTVAYNNEKASKAVGIFLRGASIDSYELINNYIYKINMGYGDPVYVVDSYYLKDHLNAGDEYKPSPAVVIESDEYYASPHLFTTVAGLKVRENPTGPAVVAGTLLNGTVVPLEYYPYNTEAWIPVTIDNIKGYIPMKFVGKRPALEELADEYQKAMTSEEQKKYAERILELGWNSNKSENIKALNLFADYAGKNNLPGVSEICKLQAQALSKAPEGESPIAQLIRKKQFGFTLNSECEPANGFKLSVLEKHLGKVIKSYSDLDDCGLGDYETNIFFEAAECIGHDLNKTYMLRSMEMKKDCGFRIAEHFVGEQTSETEFLKLGTGLISYIDIKRNVYGISGDYISYEFTFRKGMLVKVEILYYC